MRGIILCILVHVAAMGGAAAQAAPYVPDPEPERPTLHVQPPALEPSAAAPRRAVATQVNGITFVDVMVAAGFDLAGSDYGNEPALTANPLNPNQIVLTSFSGSSWASGGNSSLFYSADRGASWIYSLSVPPPTGTTTSYSCPCDQTMDWGRDGWLYGTFLHYNIDGSVASVYTAQTTSPTVTSSWTYPLSSGAAQKTNLPSLNQPDQPWLGSGPLSGSPTATGTVVAYDNFDFSYNNVETRAAESPGSDPLNFTRDAPTNVDGQQFNDGMNAGHRVAVGPDGKIYNVYQRLGGTFPGGVKSLTYLVTVSTDGGQTYAVANSDHETGAKVVAAFVYSFQGNGSKVGGVNALLGGVDAITVDATTGTVWIVYGSRATQTARDQIFLVPVTYSAGSLILGTARAITPATTNAYLPAVAVLPNGEVGVLYLSYLSPNFSWNFLQTTDGGATAAKFTTLTTFTSPFANNGFSNQRILGDYVQARAVGCSFYGTFPARGAGVNSASSIDPYFMDAPAATACSLPTLTSLSPPATCAGGPGFALGLGGTGFANGVTGRVNGVLRDTTYGSPTTATLSVSSIDITSPGSVPVDLIGALPAGGLTASQPLTVETPAASPGPSLRLGKNGGSVQLDWATAAGATHYDVRRCTANGGSCAPGPLASPATNSYLDGVLGDGNSYWYLVDAANSCGATP